MTIIQFNIQVMLSNITLQLQKVQFVLEGVNDNEVPGKLWNKISESNKHLWSGRETFQKDFFLPCVLPLVCWRILSWYRLVEVVADQEP